MNMRHCSTMKSFLMYWFHLLAKELLMDENELDLVVLNER